jgi:hypothetical protein
MFVEICRRGEDWEYHLATPFIVLDGEPKFMRVGPTYRALALLLAAALIARDVHSQTTTSGGLAGVVIDPTTAVVPDALVEIKDVAKGTTQSGKTDKEGLYQFPFLRPGTYTLRVTHPGFQEERQPSISPFRSRETTAKLLLLPKRRSSRRRTAMSHRR